MVHRNDVIRAIVELLRPLPYVNALWQGGAAAWKRVDDWSDIDLCVDANDNHTEDVMTLVTDTLQNQYGIALQFDVLQSPWPGLRQRFFRLNDSSPFMMIDFCIFKSSATDKLLEKEIHGEQIIHFDKNGALNIAPINSGEWMEKLRLRLPLLKAKFEIFQVLAEKEINRGNHIEAFMFYMGYTLNPLVEVLRIIHAPYHYSFSSRYIHYDLPADVVAYLQPLYFVGNPHELRDKWQLAKGKFGEAMKEAEQKCKN